MSKFRRSAGIRVVRAGVGQHAAPPLTREDKVRLAVLDWLRQPGHTSAGAARHFGYHRNTIRRWQKQFNPGDLRSLKPRSRRPARVRTPMWTMADATAVRTLRLQYPTYGKDKLTVLLAADGVRLSASTIGRILRWLKARGRLTEPTRHRVRRMGPSPRPHATRKPQSSVPTQPGDLIQIDTVHVSPLPGKTVFQFSGIDVISRQGYATVHAAATAGRATALLAAIRQQSPVPVKAIQVDGGSEFMAAFETACQQLGIRLFVLPPRSPKLNGCVERFNGTSRREFWECYDGDLDLPSVNQAITAWLHVYNHIRPHQSLGYRSPLGALATT